MTTDNKKPAGSGETLQAGRGYGDNSASALHCEAGPTKDFIMDRCNRQGVVEGVLPRGAEHAMTAAQLVDLLGLPSRRELGKLIAEERRAGALICSRADAPGGYFIPATRAELAGFEQATRRRAISTFKVLRSTRRALAELDGQLLIGGEQHE